MSRLQKSNIRYFVAVGTQERVQAIRLAADRVGLAGPDYQWIFGDVNTADWFVGLNKFTVGKQQGAACYGLKMMKSKLLRLLHI